MNHSASQNSMKLFFLVALSLNFIICFTLSCSGGDGEPPPPPPPPKPSANIAGYNGDGSETSPIPGATCQLVDFNGNAILSTETQLPISAITDGNGRFLLEKVPLNTEGFIECFQPSFPELILSTFVSTIGVSDGVTIKDEQVLPQTVVVGNIVRQFDTAFANSDLVAIKNERLNTINENANANVSILAAGAVILFNNMLDFLVNDIRFSNFTITSTYGALEDLSDNNQLDRNSSWDTIHLNAKNETESDIINLDLSSASNLGDLKGRAFNQFGVVLAGLRVTALSIIQGQLSDTFTDRSGNFSFSNLPAEQTYVFIKGYELANIPLIGAAVVDLGNIQVNTNVQAFGNIQGQVVNQFNDPVIGTTIIATQNGQLVGGPVQSGADGSFFIGDIPVGDTVVTRDPEINTTPATVIVLEGQTVSAKVIVRIIL